MFMPTVSRLVATCCPLIAEVENAYWVMAADFPIRLTVGLRKAGLSDDLLPKPVRQARTQLRIHVAGPVLNEIDLHGFDAVRNRCIVQFVDATTGRNACKKNQTNKCSDQGNEIC